MMARDLVSGGIFFVSFATLALILSSALPLWWVTTVELEGQMCSCGTGLWAGNVTWGNDITQVSRNRVFVCVPPDIPSDRYAVNSQTSFTQSHVLLITPWLCEAAMLAGKSWMIRSARVTSLGHFQLLQASWLQ